MGDALGVFKLGFAFPQIARQSPRGLLGTLAIFNVSKGPVPSKNVFLPVLKWDTTHQKPPILPVSGATEPRLVFERLSSRNRNAPLFVVAPKIFGMDRTLPT